MPTSPSDRPPPPEVLAAIVAAVEVAWPKPVVMVSDTEARSHWRFSNRWWVARRALVSDRPRP